jgi:aminoglycoside/choline kinase family phosphotransferase
MYLESFKGIKSLGLLDFQDAVIGSPMYDVVSVLEDARIKVPRAFALDCLKYFAAEKKLELPDVLVDYHILGTQRNLRILGVFARKYTRDKNSNYLRYIPLVLEYLNYDLSHPIMSKLKNWFDKIIN